MIIDCHTHVFPDDVAERAMAALHAAYQAEPVALPTVSGLLAHMRHCGVDRAVLCPVATKPSQVQPINDWLLGLSEERLIPFGAIHPHLPDAAGELDRLEQAGVLGLKLQPFFQGFTFDDKRTLSLLEAIGDRFVVLLHAGDEIFPLPEIQPTPQRLAGLLEQFPKLRLIAAHAGGYQLWDEVEAHLVGRRLLFDISYTTGKADVAQLGRIIAQHGHERILWGSDFPWQAQDYALEGLRQLGLPEAQETAILSANFLREVSARGAD
ncbi:MAG: amidohydrolase family protein [Armatimonadota bacterium]